jgi:hypothetical protein
MPEAIEELGMLPALGEEQEIDGRSEKLARNIYQEGASENTFRLIIPPLRRCGRSSTPRRSTGWIH